MAVWSKNARPPRTPRSWILEVLAAPSIQVRCGRDLHCRRGVPRRLTPNTSGRSRPSIQVESPACSLCVLQGSGSCATKLVLSLPIKFKWSSIRAVGGGICPRMPTAAERVETVFTAIDRLHGRLGNKAAVECSFPARVSNTEKQVQHSYQRTSSDPGTDESGHQRKSTLY